MEAHATEFEERDSPESPDPAPDEWSLTPEPTCDPEENVDDLDAKLYTERDFLEYKKKTEAEIRTHYNGPSPPLHLIHVESTQTKPVRPVQMDQNKKKKKPERTVIAAAGKTFPCPTCRQVCRSLNSFYSHTSRQHLPDVKCQACGKVMKHRTLVSHAKNCKALKRSI